jgi:hypothetical protein
MNLMDRGDMSARENDSDERRHSRSSKNKTQLKGFLEEMKENYNRESIEAVISELPPPPLIEGSETDTQELTDILNTYIKAFGPELFWQVIHELGLRPKKQRDYVHAYRSFSVNDEDMVAIDVEAQNTKTVEGQGESQTKIYEDGIVKLFLRGRNEPQYIDVKAGDLIKSTGGFITIQNLSKPMTPITAKPTNPIVIPSTS